MSPTFASSVQFLQWLKQRAEQRTRRGKISLAELAKRGGFSSRGYVGAVLTGKRKLTEESLEAFVKMLALNLTEKNLLIALIRAEKGLPQTENTLKKIQQKYSKQFLRKRVKASSSESPVSRSLTAYTFQVYAALAGAECPRIPTEIAEIANVSLELCKSELETLRQRSWIVENAGKYFSAAEHLMVDSEESKDWAQKCFLEDTTVIQNQVKTNFESKEKLFITYNFGVSKHQAPHLAKALREVLHDWVEENVEKTPEKVMSLSIALF
jgi:uncharacterized protein (TIGR02147 family)